MLPRIAYTSQVAPRGPVPRTPPTERRTSLDSCKYSFNLYCKLGDDREGGVAGSLSPSPLCRRGGKRKLRSFQKNLFIQRTTATVSIGRGERDERSKLILAITKLSGVTTSQLPFLRSRNRWRAAEMASLSLRRAPAGGGSGPNGSLVPLSSGSDSGSARLRTPSSRGRSTC